MINAIVVMAILRGSDAYLSGQGNHSPNPNYAQAQVMENSTAVASPTPATIEVTLPSEAKLIIDDRITASTAAKRVFVSPPLDPGMDYTYTIKVEMIRDGQFMTASKDIIVRAGDIAKVAVKVTD